MLGPDRRMPFGKYKGWRLQSIPEDYLQWLLDNVELFGTLENAVIQELRARAGHGKSTGYDQATSKPKTPAKAMTRQDVDSWYRALAKKWHPDRGGSKESMQAIQDAMESLLKLIGEK